MTFWHMMKMAHGAQRLKSLLQYVANYYQAASQQFLDAAY